MRILALVAILFAGSGLALTALPVSPTLPPSHSPTLVLNERGPAARVEGLPLLKPSPPVDLVARIDHGTLIVHASTRIGGNVDIAAGRHSWRGALARGEARECRFALDDPSAEIIVTACVDGVSRCVVLNERPRPALGRAAANSRGEAIVEFSPR